MVTPTGLVLLTDRRSLPGASAGELIAVVEAAVRGGAAWVVLRERDLPYAERLALAVRLREVLPAGRLIVAGPDPLGGDAVHLAEADPAPIDPVGLVGRSRHARVEPSTEDYVTLSPIFPTATKPGYGPALGPSAAAELAGSMPWLALGGIDSPARAAACAAAGASGTAVLGAVMRAADPEDAARALSEAFARETADNPRDTRSGTSAAERRTANGRRSDAFSGVLGAVAG
ncbi:MAG: thiamine phosphate synthase [Actinoplanes sp.]